MLAVLPIYLIYVIKWQYVYMSAKRMSQLFRYFPWDWQILREKEKQDSALILIRSVLTGVELLGKGEGKYCGGPWDESEYDLPTTRLIKRNSTHD